MRYSTHMPLNSLERRQVIRRAIAILAEPLEGEAKETFIREATRRMNREEPAPAKEQRRRQLRVVE